MARITVCTFATQSHYRFQDSFYNLYKDYFDDIRLFRENDIITTDFYKDNQQLFKYKKYWGYFLWKPFIINSSFDTSNSDYVLYCDSNIRFTDIVSFVNIYNRVMEQCGMFFVKHINWINKDWTKRDTFYIMECDHARYWNAYQIWSVLFSFSRDVKSKILLKEYTDYCKVPEAVTEEPNIYNLPNLEGFREHRWEQSVLSILVEKYGISTVPETIAMNLYTKIYDEDLYKLKENINKNPLETV